MPLHPLARLSNRAHLPVLIYTTSTVSTTSTPILPLLSLLPLLPSLPLLQVMCLFILSAIGLIVHVKRKRQKWDVFEDTCLLHRDEEYVMFFSVGFGRGNRAVGIDRGSTGQR